MKAKVKSIFESKTFWFAVATLWAAALPTMQGCAAENRAPNATEWLSLVTAVVTTGGTIYGRYSSDAELYTPTWMPGRSEGDNPPAA